MMKRFISLAICLFFVLALPVSASITTSPLISPESVKLNKNGLPYISDTAQVRWIDRIDGLPDYAKAFYNRLVRESSPDGALVDVTKADSITLSDGKTAYAFTVTLSGEFFFDASKDRNEIQTRRNTAGNIAAEIGRIMNKNWRTAVACMISAENAFDRDHPEVFWIGGKSRWATDISVGNLRYCEDIGRGSYVQHIYYILQGGDFDIRVEEYRDTEFLRETIAVRDEAVETIIENMPAYGTDYEKISYFNSLLTRQNGYNTMDDVYDMPHDSRECISALVGRCGEEGPVCEGYARAFKVLCDAAGIPCVITDGLAKTYADREEVMHMWNSVQADGKWYAADITWNDPATVGITSAESGYESEKWLLVGSDTVVNGMMFDESHTVHNQVTEPGVQFMNEPVIEKEGYSFIKPAV